MSKFSEHPDFNKAVAMSLKDIVDGKPGILYFSYPFNINTQEGFANAVRSSSRLYLWRKIVAKLHIFVRVWYNPKQ